MLMWRDRQRRPHGAEHQAMLRRGAGLELLPPSDLGTSLLFKLISPKPSSRDKQQKALNGSPGIKRF